jgi:AcrR family transcriptional regulator
MTDGQSLETRGGRNHRRGARRDPEGQQTSAERRRANERRARRRQLLTVAKELLLEQGYEKTSVSAIVRAAGVAQGTFYLYFKSKEQLLPHLRAEVLAEYLNVFERALSARGAVDERLCKGIAAVYRAVKRHRALVRVFRQAQSGEETERIWLEGRETLAGPLALLLEEGRAAGRLQLDEPRMAAHLVLALLDDLFYEALQYGKPASGKACLEHSTRFVLRALGVEQARVDELAPLAESVGAAAEPVAADQGTHE